MKYKATMLVVLAVLISGCLGGGGTQSDPLQELAEGDGDFDTRKDSVDAADRALEFHGVETTEENRERIAELALEVAQQDPNQTGANILICMNGAPPGEPFESYTPNGWDAIEELAEACA